MPRKKQTATSLPGAAAPARVTCPACKSEISSDGATLHARSKQLEELIEEAGGVEQLEKALAALEEKLLAARKELEQEREKGKAVAGQTKPEAGKNVEGKEQGQGSGRGGWW